MRDSGQIIAKQAGVAGQAEGGGIHRTGREQGPQSPVHADRGRHGGRGEQGAGPPPQGVPASRCARGDEQDQRLQPVRVQGHVHAWGGDQGVAAGQRDRQKGKRDERGEGGGGAAPPQADQTGEGEGGHGAGRERVRHVARERDRVRVELEAPGEGAGLPVRADEEVSGRPEAILHAPVQEQGQLQQHHEQREQHRGQRERGRPRSAVRAPRSHPDPDLQRRPHQVSRFPGARPALPGPGGRHQHSEDFLLVPVPVQRWIPAQQPPVGLLEPAGGRHARPPNARRRTSSRPAATAALCWIRATSAASRSSPRWVSR